MEITGARTHRGEPVERRYGQFLVQQEATCHRQPSRSVETLLGPVTLARPYFYCAACLDQALGLSAHRKQ